MNLRKRLASSVRLFGKTSAASFSQPPQDPEQKVMARRKPVMIELKTIPAKQR